MQRVKINNVKIKPIPGVNRPDISNIKGYNIIPDLYSVTGLIAQPESGKTTVIYNLLKHLTSPHSVVVFIVPTIFKDKSYEIIIKNLKSRKIPYIIETSFFAEDENGKEYNQLDKFVKYLKEQNDDYVWNELLNESGSEPEMESDEESLLPAHQKGQNKILDPRNLIYGNNADESEDELEPKAIHRQKGKIVPEFIFVIDDDSEEAKYNKSLISLIKCFRHIKSKVILSTQAVTDMLPDSWNMFNHLLLFANIPEQKIHLLHKSLSVPIDKNEFYRIYMDATRANKPGEKSHNFLFVDKKRGRLRKNLSEEYDLN